jgi:DNA-binding MarR family transcriptional regulator
MASDAGRHRPKAATRRRAQTDGAVPSLELATLQEFRTIFGSARRHDAEVRRLAGISGAQLWGLSAIARAEGLRVNDLAEQMALHQTTASNLVNALVQRKLVRRTRDASDQRVVRLAVTTEGKRMLLRAPGPYVGLLFDALRHLDSPDVRCLRKALVVLTTVMRGAAREAAGETLMGE